MNLANKVPKWLFRLLVCGMVLNAFAGISPDGSVPDKTAYKQLRKNRKKIAEAPARSLKVMSEDAPTRVEKKVLVLLVEFAGTNTFTWTPGVSTWDPIGKVDRDEWDGENVGNAAASQFFADYHGITGPTNFTYTGPLHNEIALPEDGDAGYKHADRIWQADFSPEYYETICFGNGTVFDYERQDGSRFYADCSGVSVSNYYAALSGGQLAVDGDVVGWVSLTNSLMYYASDPVPGRKSVARSVLSQVDSSGANPEGGTSQDLVVDACRAAALQFPDIDWSTYDQDGDGVVDSVWLIVAGRDEATSPNENLMWPHSFGVYPSVEIAGGISVSRYILMNEDCGVYVLAHEFGHRLGAIDLYSYTGGNPSIKNWSIMHSANAGSPYDFWPVPMDPYHLDGWGWLDPVDISDAGVVVTQQLHQAGTGYNVPNGMQRAIRVRLEDQQIQLPVAVLPESSTYWYGGNEAYTDASLMLPEVQVIGTNASLSFNVAYDIEPDYDFLLAHISTLETNGWSTLRLLDNEHTQNTFEGETERVYSGPFAGLSSQSPDYPDYSLETFSLAAYTGKTVRVGLSYLTDGGLQLEGPYVDEIVLDLDDEDEPLRFSADDSHSDLMNTGWELSDGFKSIPHYYYLQWRNTREGGGYDFLPDSHQQARNAGLLVWYVNELYADNNITGYLADAPSYGPKGVCMVVDGHTQVPQSKDQFEGRPCTNPLGTLGNGALSKDATFGLFPTPLLDDDVHGAYPARSFFTDARNYGAEISQTYLNPLSVPPQFEWVSRKWDASVVTPALHSYPSGAVNKLAEEAIYRVWYEKDLDKVYVYNREESDGLAGGMGNPADVNSEFGWNFQVLEDHGTSAVVRIWNSRNNGPWPVLVETVGQGTTDPKDDFLADDSSSNQVEISATPYHVISRLLWNGVEVSDAVGQESYTLNLGTVASNSSVYAFFEPQLIDESVPAVWLANHGIDPSAESLTQDPDGDGLSNAEEYAAGTDPADNTSSLQMNELGESLSWSSEWNHWYRLLSSTNLANRFEPVSDWIPGEYDSTSFEYTSAPDSTAFFKVEVKSTE